MPKKTGPASTRDRILHAVIELIAEVGADRVRTRAVADRAGVNPALVHYHFGSMATLLREAVDVVLSEEAEPFVEALQRGPRLRDAVEELFAAIQEVGEPTPGMLVSIDLFVRATRNHGERARAAGMLNDLRAGICDRLRSAQLSGELGQDVDIEAVAIMLAAILDGLGMHRMIDHELDVRRVAGPVLAALALSAQHATTPSGGIGGDDE